MRHRTVICVLLALVPLIAGCGLFSDGQELSSTPGTAPTEATAVVPSEDSASKVVTMEIPDTEAVPAVSISENSASEELTHIPSPLMASSSIYEEYGPSSLEERALRSDLVVRARLQSKTPTYRRTFDQIPTVLVYFAYVEFTFEVLEVLYGSAGDSVVVELKVSEPYSNHPYKVGLDRLSTSATQRATDWLASEYYDSQWEDRDAILFLIDVENSDSYYLEERPDTVGYAFVGHWYDTDASATDGDDWFSIASAENKVWLPATSTTNGATTFYLESPDVDEDADTETLAALKTTVATAVSDIDSSIPGHRDCLVAKKRDERKITPAGYAYTIEREIASGLPAGTEVVPRTDSSMSYWYYHLYGDDAVYFDTTVSDTDDDPMTGYDGSTKTVRPLPASRYVVEEKRQLEVMVPCGYIARELGRLTFNVVAREGTLHELFFDPVTDGASVAADADDGVLNPRNFTGAYGQAATIQRIEWLAGTVKLKVSPHTAIAGHILDFIELDGAVSLSLDVANATVDPSTGSGQAGTLSWSVSEQPWEDGDKLMVRIREAR